MAQQNSTTLTSQFTTAMTFPNPYIPQTLNNMNLIKTVTKDKKDWVKKYHKII